MWGRSVGNFGDGTVNAFNNHFPLAAARTRPRSISDLLPAAVRHKLRLNRTTRYDEVHVTGFVVRLAISSCAKRPAHRHRRTRRGLLETRRASPQGWLSGSRVLAWLHRMQHAIRVLDGSFGEGWIPRTRSQSSGRPMRFRTYRIPRRIAPSTAFWKTRTVERGGISRPDRRHQSGAGRCLAPALLSRNSH